MAPGAKLEETEARVRESLAACGGAEVLILTDVFGATPCNAALAVADGLRTRVVAGVNVPMLWRALCYVEQALEELVNRALAGGTQGVMHVVVPRRQNQPSPAPSHDQVKSQHQQ